MIAHFKMEAGAIFSSLVVCLELVLVYNCYGVDGVNHNQGVVKGRHSSPTPPVHLLLDNRLNAPLKLLRQQLEGTPNFIRMEKGEIQAGSRVEVIIGPRQPDKEIYGFIQLETTEIDRNVPVALYFSIPNEYSTQLPWYGIEIQSHDPRSVMETAMELTEVSQLNNGNRNFSYPERNDVITKVNKEGLAITAGMYRLVEKHQVIVKLIVHKVWTREDTLPMPSRPVIITTRTTRTTTSATTTTTSKTTTTTPKTTTSTPTTTTTTPKTTTTTPKTTTTTATYEDYVDPISV